MKLIGLKHFVCGVPPIPNPNKSNRIQMQETYLLTFFANLGAAKKVFGLEVELVDGSITS